MNMCCDVLCEHSLSFRFDTYIDGLTWTVLFTSYFFRTMGSISFISWNTTIFFLRCHTKCSPHPGNLLRTKDGKLCILDFGMSKFF
jgi:ABC1 atypical kinase-like domain